MSKYLLSSVHVSQVHISYTAIANMITYDTIITIIVCAFVAAQFQSKASNANNASCLKVCPHYFPINFCCQHLCGDILFW